MGRVYSWSDVERKCVPSADDFSYTTDRLRTDLARCRGIVGAVLCGSVLSETATVRSDVDCVVLYDPACRRDVMQMLRVIRRAAELRCVQLEFIPLDTQMAATPFHHLDAGFMEHIRSAAARGGTIGRYILPYLAQHESFADSFASYVRYKIRKFEHGIVALNAMPEEEYFQFLQKTLEVAVHVARKFLCMRGVKFADDAKREVIREYTEMSGNAERELFLKLVALDNRYTTELQEHLLAPDKERYALLIRNIEAAAYDALEFVRHAALGAYAKEAKYTEQFFP